MNRHSTRSVDIFFNKYGDKLLLLARKRIENTYLNGKDEGIKKLFFFFLLFYT